MSLRSFVAALFVRASAPARDPHAPRVVSTIIDGRLARAHEARLIEDGRKAIDILARTRVERTGHFDAPRFSA